MVSQTVNLAARTSGNVFAPPGLKTTFVNLPYDTSPSASNTTVFLVGSEVEGILISYPDFKVDSNSGYHTLFGGIYVDGKSTDYTVSSWFGLVTLTHKVTGQLIQFQLTKPQNAASNSGVNVEFLDGSVGFTSNLNGFGVWTVWGTQGGQGTSTWGLGSFQLPGTLTPGAAPVDLANQPGALNPSVNSSDVSSWYGYTLTTNIDTINVTGSFPETVANGLQQAQLSTWNTGDTINGNGATDVSLTLNGTMASGAATVDANDLSSLRINLLANSILDTSKFDRVNEIRIQSAAASKTLSIVGADLMSTFSVTEAKPFLIDFDSFRTTAGLNTLRLSTNGAGLSPTGRVTFQLSDQAVERVQLSAMGSNFLSLSDSSVLAEVSVEGAGKNDIVFQTMAPTTTIHAGATTGDQAYTFGSNSAVSVTSGSGNDRFDFGATLTSSDSIAGGAGVNQVFATIASTMLVRPIGKEIQQVNLSFTSPGTFQGDLFAQATTYRVSGSTADARVTRVSPTVKELVIDATNSGSLLWSYATDAFNFLTVSIGQSGPIVSSGGLISTGNATFLGVDQLVIRSQGPMVSRLGEVSAPTANAVSLSTVSVGSDLVLGNLSAPQMEAFRLTATLGDVSLASIDDAGGLKAYRVISTGEANVSVGGIGSLVPAERLTSVDFDIDSGNFTQGLIDVDNGLGTKPALRIVNFRAQGGVSSAQPQQVSLGALRGENATLDYYYNEFGNFVDADMDLLSRRIGEVTASSVGYIEIAVGRSSSIHYQGFSVNALGGLYVAVDSESTVRIDRLTDTLAQGSTSKIGDIVVSGAGQFQLTSVLAKSVSLFDSTALTGRVSADFSAVASSMMIFLGGGGTGPDGVRGSTEGDVIIAGAGSDRLWGNGGADQLTPGGGVDYVHGGFGTDSIDLRESASASDSLYYQEAGSQNVDVVTGLEVASDHIYYKTTETMSNNGLLNVIRDTGGNALSAKVAGTLSLQACISNNSYNMTGANVVDSLYFSTPSAGGFAGAIGGGAVTHAPFGVSSTGVITIWYDDTMDEAVFGYLMEANSDSVFTSQDTFVEVARVGMAFSEYSLANLKSILGTF